LGLALGADEQHAAATGDRLRQEVERALEQTRGLVEVDDVDAAARTVDERAHLRVPALGLMTEVDAGFEQLLDAQGLFGVADGAIHFRGRFEGARLGIVSHFRACPFG
jgi:hypothetical protein